MSNEKQETKVIETPTEQEQEAIVGGRSALVSRRPDVTAPDEQTHRQLKGHVGPGDPPQGR